jgi:hypothetical protein
MACRYRWKTVVAWPDEMQAKGWLPPPSTFYLKETIVMPNIRQPGAGVLIWSAANQNGWQSAPGNGLSRSRSVCALREIHQPGGHTYRPGDTVAVCRRWRHACTVARHTKIFSGTTVLVRNTRYTRTHRPVRT